MATCGAGGGVCSHEVRTLVKGPCKCYLPPWTTDDPELCNAVGGTCMGLNEIPDLFPPPESTQEPLSPTRQGGGCPPPVQRRMEVPFELCPDYWEWMDNRYIWELTDDD